MSRSLLSAFLDCLHRYPKCNHRVLAIGNTGLHTRALRTPPTLLAAGPTLLYQKSLSRVAQTDHEPESARATARYLDSQERTLPQLHCQTSGQRSALPSETSAHPRPYK